MEERIMRKILLILGVAILASGMYAQELTHSQRYKMNEDALKMVSDYKASANMSKPRRFMRLFENENTQIYNDLLGLSAKKTLSVKEYRTLMENEAMYPTIKIQNLKKDGVYYENGRWMMDLTFEKEITYTDKCGVLFSTEEYYNAYHTLNMTLAWSEDATCTIVKLSGTVKSSKQPLEDYKVITAATNDKDKKKQKNIRVSGKSLKFNSFDQSIVPANCQLTYVGDQDMKVELVQNESGCEVYTISYDPMSMRLRPHYNLGAILPYGKSNDEGISLSNAMHHEVGLDLGYMMPSTGKFQFGIYTGVGFVSSQAKFGIDSLSYKYNASAEADIDGDTYVRHYTLTNVSQKVKMMDLTVPVYLDLNVHLTKTITMYMDLGIKNYLNLSANLSNVTGTYSAWGVYSQYSDLMLDHTTGLSQFASQTSFDAASTAKELEMNKYSMDLLTALGVRILLKDKAFFPLQIDLGVGYQHSLIAPYKNASVTTFSELANPKNGDNALMSYTMQGGENIKPLTCLVSNLTRKMFTFNFAITYKF